MHPEYEKLLNLHRQVRPSETTSSVAKMLQESTKARENYQGFEPPPLRFKASLPSDQIVLNQELSIHIMYLERVAILQTVHTHSIFLNEIVLRSKYRDHIWIAFIECWETVFAGY